MGHDLVITFTPYNVFFLLTPLHNESMGFFYF